MYLTVNGVRLYYEKTGTGRPLIMAHCNSMDHKIFRGAAKVLSRRFTVYCPDARDHGKSQKVKQLRHPAKMQVVSGSVFPQRMREIAAGAEIRLSREDWYSLYLAAGFRLP